MRSLDQWNYSDVGDGVQEGDGVEDLPGTFETTQESDLERTSLRCVGASCFVVIAFVAFTSAIHAIPLGWVSEAPAFARSLLFLSVSHQTDEWAEHFATLPPPPPQFLDGSGNRL